MSVCIQTKALPMAFMSQEYNYKMKADTYPKRNVVWSINKDTPLPFGLEMNADGEISGKPSRLQIISVQFYASAKEPDETESCILDMNVYKKLVITNEQKWDISMSEDNKIILNAEGGVQPYKWSCDSLPIGLELDGDNLVGRPAVSGGLAFISVKVEDSVGNVATGSYQIKICK